MTTNTTPQDAYMASSDSPPPSSPPSTDFWALSVDDQDRVNRMVANICEDWETMSPASVFPSQYLPDPESQNWGVQLLNAIQYLVKFTKGQMAGAVAMVVESVERRNNGMSAADGASAICLEDVQWAIKQVRWGRNNTYVPNYEEEEQQYPVRSETDTYFPVYDWQADYYRPNYENETGTKRRED